MSCCQLRSPMYPLNKDFNVAARRDLARPCTSSMVAANGKGGSDFEPERVRKAERPPEFMRGKPRRRTSPPALEAQTNNGGEGGIRTLGTLTRSTVFETAP